MPFVRLRYANRAYVNYVTDVQGDEQMKAPVSQLKNSTLQKAPQALMRAAEKARQLAEQTGTPFVTRPPAPETKPGKPA